MQPNYGEMQKKYAHLSEIIITDHDTKKICRFMSYWGQGIILK